MPVILGHQHEPAPSAADTANADASADVSQLRARLEELTRERDQLLAVVDLQQEVGGSLQVTDILQRIARRLGELFGLDRSSIYLVGEGRREARLVATYEDPTLGNLVVDLARYPELAHAFESGETVFIPDARTDPRLVSVRSTLDTRKVGSIVVAPMRFRAAVIGAIVLRSERNGPSFSERDIAFCEVIASLAARALRNAHRFERVRKASDAEAERRRRAELERIALVAFLRRLLDRYARSDDQRWSETLLPRESDEELDRLVSVTMQVLGEEAKG